MPTERPSSTLQLERARHTIAAVCPPQLKQDAAEAARCRQERETCVQQEASDLEAVQKGRGSRHCQCNAAMPVWSTGACASPVLSARDRDREKQTGRGALCPSKLARHMYGDESDINELRWDQQAYQPTTDHIGHIMSAQSDAT